MLNVTGLLININGAQNILMCGYMLMSCRQQESDTSSSTVHVS